MKLNLLGNVCFIHSLGVVAWCMVWYMFLFEVSTRVTPKVVSSKGDGVKPQPPASMADVLAGRAQAPRVQPVREEVPTPSPPQVAEEPRRLNLNAELAASRFNRLPNAGPELCRDLGDFYHEWADKMDRKIATLPKELATKVQHYNIPPGAVTVVKSPTGIEVYKHLAPCYIFGAGPMEPRNIDQESKDILDQTRKFSEAWQFSFTNLGAKESSMSAGGTLADPKPSTSAMSAAPSSGMREVQEVEMVAEVAATQVNTMTEAIFAVFFRQSRHKSRSASPRHDCWHCNRP